MLWGGIEAVCICSALLCYAKSVPQNWQNKQSMSSFACGKHSPRAFGWKALSAFALGSSPLQPAKVAQSWEPLDGGDSNMFLAVSITLQATQLLYHLLYRDVLEKPVGRPKYLKRCLPNCFRSKTICYSAVQLLETNGTSGSGIVFAKIRSLFSCNPSCNPRKRAGSIHDNSFW